MKNYIMEFISISGILVGFTFTSIKYTLKYIISSLIDIKGADSLRWTQFSPHNTANNPIGIHYLCALMEAQSDMCDS